MAQQLKYAVVQITQDMHESEERFVLGYNNDGVFQAPVIATYASLSTEEKVTYDAFKALVVSKIPAE